GQEAVAKKTLPGQKDGVPSDGQADEERVEKTLVVGEEQRATATRDVLMPFGTQTKPDAHHQRGEGIDALIPERGKPTLLHRRYQILGEKKRVQSLSALLFPDSVVLFFDLSYHPLDDLLHAERGGIENDGVRRRHHGRQVTGGVAAVALLLGAQHFVPGKVFPPRGHFALPPPGALLGVGHEKEFARGIGK